MNDFNLKHLEISRSACIVVYKGYNLCTYWFDPTIQQISNVEENIKILTNLQKNPNQNKMSNVQSEQIKGVL